MKAKEDVVPLVTEIYKALVLKDQDEELKGRTSDCEATNTQHPEMIVEEAFLDLSQLDCNELVQRRSLRVTGIIAHSCGLHRLHCTSAPESER